MNVSSCPSPARDLHAMGNFQSPLCMLHALPGFAEDIALAPQRLFTTSVKLIITLKS